MDQVKLRRPVGRAAARPPKPPLSELPRITAPDLRQDTPAAGQVRVLANPTDAHGVYADPYAWELALKCIQAMRPHVITWGNDAMDCGVISTYSKVGELPSISAELEDEQRRRRELLSAAPRAELWWIADNHVIERWVRYMHNRAPELADVDAFRFHNLIGFPREKIVEEYLAGDTLRVIHGTYVKKSPGASVLAHILDDPLNRRERITRSVMMGHVHRFAHVSLDNGIEGLECGCLQNLRPEYLRSQRLAANWCHGLGFARYGAGWSQIVPARFFVRGSHLVCRLEGQEHRVKITSRYSGL